MSRQRATPAEGDDQYEIRPYEPADRDGFLALYERVFGDASREWFSWKYEENPAVDHVPMIVAVADGRVVGTKPCVAFRMRVGDSVEVALQPADVMVHPDHRRRGLYSRTTEYLKEYYADREPAFIFNFPNQATLSGSLKHGWKVVEERRSHYRIQRPRAMTGDGRLLGTVAALTTPLVETYLRLRDARAPTAPQVAVQRHDDVPANLLASLYRSAVPEGIHAVRDEDYYLWRYRNPTWSYRVYSARTGDAPVAAVVTGTRETGGTTLTAVVDAVPLVERADRTMAFAALLGRVVDDHDGSDAILLRDGTLPAGLAGSFGFHPDDQPPVSWVATPTTHVTYPLTGDGSWTLDGFDLTDPESWRLTLGEEDTY
jgi:GNAT superfamily N-acetyltransferase